MCWVGLPVADRGGLTEGVAAADGLGVASERVAAAVARGDEARRMAVAAPGGIAVGFRLT